MLGIPEHRWSDTDARWLANFAEERVELLEGARELLAELQARAVRTGIVTSGSRDRVRRELDAHGFVLDACVYGCDVQEKKPHPEGLLLCLERIGVDAREAVYVGDSPEDIAMARAAGVYSIAVPGSYPNREALLASNPDAFADSLRDVTRVLDAR
jgi:HAD superfamily hydrolase (TIGR01509 family)